MMLGSDVSALSTTAASAAAKGLSIVVPVYNEAAGLAVLHQRICDIAKTLRQRYRLACEVVYVDDGSADATLSIARSLPADAMDVQVVSLSRNFGKEAALMAGLDHARLGAVLFMDGDGQHPPALVEQLVRHWIEDGHDVVYTAKAHRDNEPFLRRGGGRGGGQAGNVRAQHHRSGSRFHHRNSICYLPHSVATLNENRFAPGKRVKKSPSYCRRNASSLANSGFSRSST